MAELYLLVATAVYDHGVLAAYTDPDRAETIANELLARSDKWHSIEIRRVEVDRDPADDDVHDGNTVAQVLRFGQRHGTQLGTVVRTYDEGDG